MPTAWRVAGVVLLTVIGLAGCYGPPVQRGADLTGYIGALGERAEAGESKMGDDTLTRWTGHPPATIAVARLQRTEERTHDTNVLVPLTWEREAGLDDVPGFASLMDEAAVYGEVQTDASGVRRLLESSARAGADWLVLFTFKTTRDNDFVRSLDVGDGRVVPERGAERGC